MENDKILEFFQATLRQPLFTGFLTASGFLFSAKAFLITNLYRDVFSTTEYRERAKRIHQYDNRVRLTSPLRWLQRDLLCCIVTTLLVAASQITIGFLQYSWVPYFCYFAAILGLLAMFWAMYKVRYAMIAWLTFIEETYGPCPNTSEEREIATNNK